MSMSNAFEHAVLRLLFLNEAIATLGDASGLLPSAVDGSLYVSGHTADPGEAGNQSSSEATYTGYARSALARDSGGWTVTGNQVENAGVISLGACTAGSETLTHWGIGAEASGSTLLLYYGPLIASGAIWLPFTAKTDDSITVPGHTFVVDQRIAFAPAYQGSLPTGMGAGTVYWVRTVSGDDITVSTTQGGSALNLTAVGSGVCICCSSIAVSENITPQFAAGALTVYQD
jgi:hypothetical protein